MPIPHDLEKRWWVEVGDANQELTNSFRSVLMGFLAFDRNRLARLVGTGFIVAAEPRFALICSAKHVFTEGVLAVQRPVRGHASSSLFVRAVDKTPSVDPHKLKVVWAPANSKALMLDVVHLNYNDVLDIAGCIVATQDGESMTERFAIPLDTDVPSTGDVVHMVGMSGGFVYWPRNQTTIAACGIVCADNSTEESHHDCFRCGESVIACAWPALSLRFPLTVPSPPDEPAYTLFEMVHRGLLPPPLGGIEHITVIETGNGDCIVGNLN